VSARTIRWFSIGRATDKRACARFSVWSSSHSRAAPADLAAHVARNAEERERKREREILVSLGHLEREINLKWTAYTSSRSPRVRTRAPGSRKREEIAKPVASRSFPLPTPPFPCLPLRPIEMLVVKGKARGDNARNGFRNFRGRRLGIVTRRGDQIFRPSPSPPLPSPVAPAGIARGLRQL